MEISMVEEDAKKVIMDYLGLKCNITRAVTFTDLGADSLDIHSIFVELERKFCIELSGDDMVDLENFGEIVDHISEKVKEKKPQ